MTVRPPTEATLTREELAAARSEAAGRSSLSRLGPGMWGFFGAVWTATALTIFAGLADLPLARFKYAALVVTGLGFLVVFLAALYHSHSRAADIEATERRILDAKKSKARQQ